MSCNVDEVTESFENELCSVGKRERESPRKTYLDAIEELGRKKRTDEGNSRR